MSYMRRSFQDLKKIAKNLGITYTETPMCALKLIDYFEIPHGNENVAIRDFKDKDNPLWEVPACLYIDEYGKRKIYYNSITRFWNFYLMHEVAHYFLEHRERSYQNEIEADLLACILVMPPDKLKRTIHNAYGLGQAANIPIDRADMYWQEILDEREQRK